MLPPTGGCNVQSSSDQTADVATPPQIPQGGPPSSPRRGGSGIVGADSSRTVNGSAYGSCMRFSSMDGYGENHFVNKVIELA
jgi:hypothetical protein